jgi:alkanesulfonate monooxygenase SsuD/methylene tetrahydromethanopterin reductase-like flavin-dependent oxidoreductase (luciferase family)
VQAPINTKSAAEPESGTGSTQRLTPRSLSQLTQITEVAEERGFNGVWPLDHVLVGPDLKHRYPWVIEPLTLLGFLAARSSRIVLARP